MNVCGHKFTLLVQQSMIIDVFENSLFFSETQNTFFFVESKGLVLAMRSQFTTDV